MGDFGCSFWPDETPCPGCGWPMYCCLCLADDVDDEGNDIEDESEADNGTG